jgi:hypothetical protein
LFCGRAHTLNLWNSLNIFSVARTIDYTDYLVLPVLIVSYYFNPPAIDLKQYKLEYYLILIVSWFAVVGTGGTHGKITMYEFQISHSDLASNVDILLVSDPRLTDLDSSYYEITPEPPPQYVNGKREFVGGFTRVRLKDSNGDEVFAFKYYGDQESADANPNQSRLSIVYVGKHRGKSRMGSDLTEKETQRISEKFQRLFLSRIGIPFSIVDD